MKDTSSERTNDPSLPTKSGSTPLLSRSAPGNVIIYAAAAGAAGVVPVPFADLVIAKLARGSAMRRVARRRGVRLTPAARVVLSQPGLAMPLSTTPARLLRTAVARALAPLRIASRMEDSVATFLSAILFDHYLANSARSPGSPLDEPEARTVRSAMEQAFADSGLEALRSVPAGVLQLVVHAGKTAWAPDGEGRGPVERFSDALLDGVADAPSDVVQRMRDHFDAALAKNER